MATITGTSGNDNLDGTRQDDVFKMGRGGDDTAIGKGGNDTFRLNAAFTAADSLQGGDGVDMLSLRGDYSAGVVFGVATATSIEAFKLAKGFDYNLTTHDTTVDHRDVLTVDASALAAGDQLIFDGSAETDGEFNITAGAGDDHITGGEGFDEFHLEHGGTDTVIGGKRNNLFYFGDTLTAGDTVDGGKGGDQLTIGGDYGAGLTFSATTMVNIESLILTEGYDYTLTTNDANVTGSLFVGGIFLEVGDTLVFDYSAETDGTLRLFAGRSDCDVVGGARQDQFDLRLTGLCLASGGNAKDTFSMGANFDSLDVVDGGKGIDSVFFFGAYADFVITAAMMSNVEILNPAGEFGYDLTTEDGVVAAGANLTVDADGSRAASLIFDGSAETDGTFALLGTEGADTLTGGALDDVIDGRRSGDILTGRGGADELTCGTGGATNTLVYAGAADSTGTTHDTVTDFDADRDAFDVSIAVTNVVADTGTINLASFDTDMASEANDWTGAKVMTVTGGDLIGHVFLLVDLNASVSYEAGSDLVIDITGFAGTLDTTDFV
jgi:hypothetical protein